MTIFKKDYLLISNKLLETARKNGIERNAVRLIIKQNNTILMLRRAKSDHFPDLYELPGGGLKKDEDIFSAGKRELLEETSLSVKEFLSMPDSFDFNAASDNKKCRGYVLNVLTGKKDIILNPDEHSEYRWVTVEEINSLPMLSNIRKLIKTIFTK